jgi:chromosome partitioning protein
MNMKGGVGKTTLAVNVAYALAAIHKKNVLIVDGDPQFNATQYLLEDDAYLTHLQDAKKGTIKDIFIPRKQGAINTVTGSARGVDKTQMALGLCTCSIFNGGPGRGKLDLIPSTLALMEIETSPRQTEKRLKSYLDSKAAGYDYVIIDCPPTISIFTQAAILASSKYLVPVKPDPLSVVGLPLLERWLEQFTYDAGVTIESVGLVYTLVRGPLPTAMSDVMKELRRSRKTEVFTNQLSVSTDVAKSVVAHKPIFEYKPNTKTANQIVAITDEFVARTS